MQNSSNTGATFNIIKYSAAIKVTVENIIVLLNNNNDLSAVIGSDEYENKKAVEKLQKMRATRTLSVINNGDHLLVY